MDTLTRTRSTSAMRTRALLVLVVCTSAAHAQSQAVELRLTGLDGIAKTVGLAELQALPQKEIADSSAEAGRLLLRGPTLRSVVSLVGAPEGRALRGPAMTIVVVAEATDGYKVAYALAELDEQFGARGAIVVLTENGKPLAARVGPLRIAVAGEMHRARWIRQLTALRLVRVE